jgi:hypothetical protein
VALADRAHLAAAQRVLQRALGGHLDEVHEVRARAAVRLGGEPVDVDGVDRPLGQRAAQDRSPGGPVGRQHEHRAVQPAGAPQRGVDVPRVVGGGEDEDALVVGLRAVELGQELVDDVASAAVAQVRALLAERVELVEEQHARGAAAGDLERLVQAALALAHPHVLPQPGGP